MGLCPMHGSSNRPSSGIIITTAAITTAIIRAIMFDPTPTTRRPTGLTFPRPMVTATIPATTCRDPITITITTMGTMDITERATMTTAAPFAPHGGGCVAFTARPDKPANGVH